MPKPAIVVAQHNKYVQVAGKERVQRFSKGMDTIRAGTVSSRNNKEGVEG
jgi:hypothetical protein